MRSPGLRAYAAVFLATFALCAVIRFAAVPQHDVLPIASKPAGAISHTAFPFTSSRGLTHADAVRRVTAEVVRPFGRSDDSSVPSEESSDQVRDDTREATAATHLIHDAPSSSAPDGVNVQRVEICRTFDGSALTVAEALQDCIDRAPAGSILEIPAGTYVLGKQIVVSKPLTIRTSNSTDPHFSCVTRPVDCAVFMADREWLDDNGILYIRSTDHVTLEHVVLDGNRDERLSSVAARRCLEGRNIAGFNASVMECDTCGLDDVVSRNALCGTGLVWSGADASIERSAFVGNGDASTPRMWADGLTLLYAPDSEIRMNQFLNNSDIALIIGYGARTRIEANLIVQRTQPAFAGLMLHNFGSDDVSFRGDFRDAVITDNTIDCGPQLCVFGMQVGPRPWDWAKNIVGGDLHENRIRGAKVGINVDGAGTFRAPTRIFGNLVVDTPTGARFSDCAGLIPTAWMNVAPNSVVDRHEESSDTAVHLSDLCQLSSRLAP